MAKPKKEQTKAPPAPPPPPRRTRGEARAIRLALRREAKFDRHAIRIEDYPHPVKEERHAFRSNNKRTVMFRYAVYAGQQQVGQTETRRSALKLAHQTCRNRT